MKIAFSIISGLFLSFSAISADYPQESIKVEKSAKNGHKALHVPLASYTNAAGTQVDLVGAIHVADEEYFEDLNKRFQQYDQVLYEMIDGEQLARYKHLQKKQKLTVDEAQEFKTLEELFENNKGMLSRVLSFFYKTLGETLKLKQQVEIVDYGFEHFVHADMSTEELDAAMDERGESWISFILKNMGTSGNKVDTSLPAMIKRIREAGGQTRALRGLMIDLLGQEGSTDALNDTAIIVSRNIKTMEVLDEVLAGGKHKKIAVFYGAAHLPDFDKRLKERGFKLKGVEWMEAINEEMPVE